MGICRYGARIRFEAVRRAPTIHPNLATTQADTNQVMANITQELKLDRLLVYPNTQSLPTHYTTSPLGLIDKSDGGKRRIHHLFYPTNTTGSINWGIPEEFGTIAYSSVHDAIQAIQTMGVGSLLIKRDFESTFRHIPFSPVDSPLLGFHWQGKYEAEWFLAFGLRTASYLFDLFSAVFHCILGEELRILGLPARIIHYLDDFLIVLPPHSEPIKYPTVFARLCEEVGLRIKESKNEEGTRVSFASIELDTRQMAIQLQTKSYSKLKLLDRASRKRH